MTQTNTETAIQPGFIVATQVAGHTVGGEVIGVADHDGRMVASIVINQGPLVGYMSCPCEMLTVIGKRVNPHWKLAKSQATGAKDTIQLGNDFTVQVRKAYGEYSPVHLEQFAVIIMEQLNDAMRA